MRPVEDPDHAFQHTAERMAESDIGADTQEIYRQ